MASSLLAPGRMSGLSVAAELPRALPPHTESAKSADQKRRKRYAPKVRTGCLTCKKRRVKCDETKPKCLKCLNADYQCDGYAVPKAWIFTSSATERQSTKPESERSESTSEEDEEKVLILLPKPSSHTFTSDEARSIQFYLRRSGRQVAKYDHSRYAFWLETLPKAAHRFESIKHALVAVALQDELHTSAVTIPRIERRITYHYQQALSKTVHSNPTIDHILLNCLSLFYFDSLRSNVELVVLHIEAARRIIDEWRNKDEKVSMDMLDLIAAVDAIVVEARTYSQTAPNLPPTPEIDWERVPAVDPYDTAEDAEHGLIATVANLSRPVGQTPLALVRARVVLAAWVGDSRNVIRNADADLTINLAALFQAAEHTIHLLDTSSSQPQSERWFQLYRSVQDIPRLRSVKYRKPVAALVNVLKQKAETKEQVDITKAMHKHLQRGILYDG